MRKWLVALLLCLPVPGWAQSAPRFAVLSLLGDGLLLATREHGVGGGSEKAGRYFSPLQEAGLDNAVVLAVDDALRKVGVADAVLLSLRDPAVYKAQAGAVESDSVVQVLMPMLRPVAENAKVTHLVLLSKYRADAMMRMADGTTGIGKVEGLGFYVDRSKRLRNTRTGETSTGYVAPFAYFNISVVHVESGKVLAQARALESAVISKASAHDPWDSLTTEEKVRALRGLVRGGVDRELPALMQSAR